MTKSIEERITDLGEYFLGMNVEQADNDEGIKETVIYMSAKFSDRWIIPPDVSEKYNIQYYEDESEAGKYFFFSDLETGFGKVLDAIEYTVRENRIAEEKSKIFTEKVQELKRVFENEDYSVKDLRNLEFTIKKEVPEKPVKDVVTPKKTKKEIKEENK